MTLGVTNLVKNVAVVVIDSGPAGANNIINVPFVSVTACRPGTSICQTIDHVLVDTGSYGRAKLWATLLSPPAGSTSRPLIYWRHLDCLDQE